MCQVGMNQSEKRWKMSKNLHNHSLSSSPLPIDLGRCSGVQTLSESVQLGELSPKSVFYNILTWRAKKLVFRFKFEPQEQKIVFKKFGPSFSGFLQGSYSFASFPATCPTLLQTWFTRPAPGWG